MEKKDDEVTVRLLTLSFLFLFLLGLDEEGVVR